MVKSFYHRKGQPKETPWQWRCMYAIGTLPLIRELQPLANQVWYVDDSAAGSTIAKLKDWWTKLCQKGAKYGYFVNNMKTKLLIKEEYSSLAQDLFSESGIAIVSDGVVYLGGRCHKFCFFHERTCQTQSC